MLSALQATPHAPAAEHVVHEVLGTLHDMVGIDAYAVQACQQPKCLLLTAVLPLCPQVDNSLLEAAKSHKRKSAARCAGVSHTMQCRVVNAPHPALTPEEGHTVSQRQSRPALYSFPCSSGWRPRVTLRTRRFLWRSSAAWYNRETVSRANDLLF